MPNYAAVVLSAGSGKRMKSDIPKQYMNLLMCIDLFSIMSPQINFIHSLVSVQYYYLN